MKKLLILILVLCAFHISRAQLIKKIINKTKQKTEEKISEKVSEKASDAATKPIDESGNGKKNDGKKDEKTGNDASGATSTSSNPANANSSIEGTPKSGTPTLATYSKYDFIPGEKVLVFEDFSQDAIGDFPAKWNTNSTGEVVKVEGQSGQWLMVKKRGRFVPDFITGLPDNFTLQFDLICNEKFSYYSNSLDLFILSGGQTKEMFEYTFVGWEKRSGTKVTFHPANTSSNGGKSSVETFEDGTSVIRNEVNTKQFNIFENKNKVKVSIWRQKQRIRVYLDEEKVFDLPRAFQANKTYDLVLFDIWSGMNNDVDRYLINNITLAVGAPDTRNKLITEGKFVTTGILFDVNSDKIRPESYGVLKEIANVLNENADVKIKIVGHTDSDGDDASNLELSKKRSAAVRAALANEFKIGEDRMQTDGMGEKQPVGDNKTAEGKANNRRVEFIKL
jgi:OmpA-OmpF porin, OOP family